MSRWQVWLVAIGLLATTEVRSQTTSDSIAFDAEAERTFVQAMRALQAGESDSAVALFQEHLRRFPRGHRWTGAMIMEAKALYQSDRPRESIRLLRDLLDIVPTTLYSFDAHYTLGLNYYRLLRYEEAALEFLQVRQGARDSLLTSRSEMMLQVLMSEHLTPAQMESLRSSATDSTVIALISLSTAEMLQREGDTRRAIAVLKELVIQTEGQPYVEAGVILLRRLEEGRVLKIGAVLPLMLQSQRPGVREVGLEFLQGMTIAIDDFNRRSMTKVALEVRDTQRDPAGAVRAVSELADDESVVAVLGPITSDEVFASAGVANAKGLTLLTPTATANGIAAIGPYIFQGNPDYEARGRAMVAFAWDRLGARKFAVLAPTDAVGKLMADGFISEVQNRRGDMVGVQWYYSGSTDLRSQLEEIRRTALKRKEVPFVEFVRGIDHAMVNAMILAGASQEVVDSLMEVGGTMSVDSLFPVNGRLLADSLKIPTKLPEIKYDSLGIAVDSIDAIFVPIASSEEIAVVSSQLSLFNYQASILGTGDWNEPAELDRNRRYTNGVYFSVDGVPDQTGKAYRTFATAYTAVMKRPPTINAFFGYDAATVLLQAIERGANLRPEIADALATVRGFHGLHGRISFLPNRVNGALTVLRYFDGSITKVTEVDLTEIPVEEVEVP